MQKENSKPIKIFKGKNPCHVKTARITSFASSDNSRDNSFGLKKSISKDNIISNHIQMDVSFDIKKTTPKDNIVSNNIQLDNKISKTIEVYKFKSPFTKL